MGFGILRFSKILVFKLHILDSMGKMIQKIFKRLRLSSGFTLLENVLCITIISIGLFTGMNIMKKSVIQTVEQDISVIATYVIQEKMENIIADHTNMGFDQIKIENYPVEIIEVGSFDFEVKVMIEKIDSASLNELSEDSTVKRVGITVSWGGDLENKINMFTLVSESDEV
ncbi:hypothetical protein BVY03_02950 [bacterium K02(2017)]|nr:hypothetical protein BVY03_02950 [bacterium K02(2017)]